MKKAFVNIFCTLPTIETVGWSTLSGVIGTLILAGFFSGIMTLELVSILLPLIVGANASISGYMLIERAGDEFERHNWITAMVGLLVAVLSALSVNVLCLQMGGFYLLSIYQAMTAAILGVLGGWSGGVLAVKYKQLREETAAS